MNRTEWKEFLKYVEDLFEGVKLPKSARVMQTWYEPFESISYPTATKMLEFYFRNEGGRFSYAKLLNYRGAIPSAQVEEKKVDCKHCGGSGWVQVMKIDDDKRKRLKAYRCTCEAGNRIYSNARQIDRDLIEGYHKINSIWCKEDIYEPIQHVRGND